MRKFSVAKLWNKTENRKMSSSSISSVHRESLADSDSDVFVSETLINDIERFALFSEQLRRSLDSNTTIPDGESMCVSVHAALSMVSQSIRDLIMRHPVFKTSQVLLLASQLIHSVKELNFDNSNVDSSRTFTCLERLEAAVGNALKQNLHRSNTFTSKTSTATIGRKIRNGCEPVKNGRSLTRRHSTYQPKVHDDLLSANEMDRIVVDRSDGIDIVFERGKAWTKYCKELLNYVSRRAQLEAEHAKRVQSLGAQTKLAMNEHYLPLKEVFDSNFDNDVAFSEQALETVKYIQDRFIKSLELRREDHERQRRSLKNEWIRVSKQVKDTQQELSRARSSLSSKDDGYRKAQENFLRTESTGPAVGSEVLRRRKELEKRRKNEEDALNKRDEAQNQVERLEVELERRHQQMEEAKVRIIGQLRELVYRCDQTTKACSTHYFQALANLWVSQPGKYHEFADATRTYVPGAEYMSFLQSLPRRTASSNSLFRIENGEELSSANRTTSSSSVSSHRRNAIDLFDSEILSDRILSERKAKKSFARLTEQPFENAIASDAIRSHRLQRIRQPTKCAHCETLSILSTAQCAQCGLAWHKSCLSRITVFCGQNRRTSSDNSRRVSIFGIPLDGYIGDREGIIPAILERCVEELQKRGLKIKGIYRTCGVKSKIEQICEDFERSDKVEEFDLSVYHPMNIASVVKLYLRKLPEPLLTHELYNEWIVLAEKHISEENSYIVDELKSLVFRLPNHNLNTLKYLLLHLNRVTWFMKENLMTASNLGAVISPSLIWKPSSAISNGDPTFLGDAHFMSKAVELLVKYAFDIFEIDRLEDWQEFFQKYPEIEVPEATDAELETRFPEGLDDDDLLDDETDPVCSSFLQQPPTPDLLKNTSRTKNDSFSTTDEIDIDTYLGSFGGLNRLDSGLLRFNLYAKTTEPGRSDTPRPKMEKKRSYTTSILVSPRPDRKTHLPQRQHSMDEKKSLSLCSGDVTINIGEGQFFIPPSDKEYTMTDGDSDTNLHLAKAIQDRLKLNHQSDGEDEGFEQSTNVLFAETDGSYV